MLRTLLTLAGVVALLGAGAPAIAGGCKGCDKVAHKGEGFCCGKGQAFGVELTSRKLYNQLEGHAVDTEKIKCSGCKYAAKTGGRCSHCNVGIANGKAYTSTVAHMMPASAQTAPTLNTDCFIAQLFPRKRRYPALQQVGCMYGIRTTM